MRVFLGDGGIVDADPDRKRSGRGAYLCWKVECLWEARKRNRFARALRRMGGGAVDDALLSERIAERLRERMLRRLHTARRAGAVLPHPAPEVRLEDVRAVVLSEGAAVPEGLGGVSTIDVGPRERLALALQAPQAAAALVLDAALAHELQGLATVRLDFLRTPPGKNAPRGPRPPQAPRPGNEGPQGGTNGDHASGSGGGGGKRRAPRQAAEAA